MAVVKPLVVFAFVVVGLAVLLYVPIPDGYSTSTSLRMRALFAQLKIAKFVANAGEAVGYAPSYVTLRAMEGLLVRTSRLVEGVTTRNEMFGSVSVRVYEPAGREKGVTLPGIVYYHGGGWTIGSVYVYDPLVRQLCALTNTVIVSVEYRLAPEWKYPAAHDDCVTATKHFLRHASDYNVDPNRVAIAGDSAGGNLAAAVALKLRDESFPLSVRLQVLIYPAVQFLHYQLPSMQSNADGPVLIRSDMPDFAANYLNLSTDVTQALISNDHVSPSAKRQYYTTHLNSENLPQKYLRGYAKPSLDIGNAETWKEIRGTFTDPYVSPLLAPDLGHPPAAFVLTCEHDVLRDEGLLYAHRLRAAGVNVEQFNHDIGFHGEFSFALEWPETQAALGEIVAFIRKNL